MEFLAINKSANPPKVSRLKAASTHEAVKALKKAGVDNYSLFCNVSDAEIFLLLTQTSELQKRIVSLEKTIKNILLTKQPKPSPAEERDSQPPQSSAQSNSISVHLTEKILSLSNPDADIYQDSLIFSITLTNLTAKHIRAVKGDLVFSDLFNSH
ncbi:MAG: hypothetical protein D3903_17345 [Candidatus Electrothrix sp. GM3_4]|nr:hypothetical protein [Candidatus Electrothrix sp. GM3_4]